MEEDLEVFRLTSALSDLISIYYVKVPNEQVKRMKEWFDVQKVLSSRVITTKSRSYHKIHQLKSFKRKSLRPIEESVEVSIPVEESVGGEQDAFCVIL